jgi:hypothetical protein
MQCDSRRSQWTALGKGATECGRFVFGRLHVAPACETALRYVHCFVCQ